jgi:hypothetical protein
MVLWEIIMETEANPGRPSAESREDGCRLFRDLKHAPANSTGRFKQLSGVYSSLPFANEIHGRFPDIGVLGR